MDPQKQLAEICERVAEATSLEEGPSGVETVLRLIHRLQPASPKAVAAEVGLPIPLVSAIRRELEKQGWLVRKGGMVFSSQYASVVGAIWGVPPKPAPLTGTEDQVSTLPTPFPVQAPEQRDGLAGKRALLDEVDQEARFEKEMEKSGLKEDLDQEDLFADYLGEEDLDNGDIEDEDLEEEGIEGDASASLDYIPLPQPDGEDIAGPFMELLEEIYEERPSADPGWDQSHATLETVLRRAELFLDLGLIQGKRALLLGDDDLTSLVTLLMVRKTLGEEVLRGCMMVVVEVDPRLVEFIGDMAQSEDLPLAVLQADLRQSLPKTLSGSFDFFFTDPPYTPDGVSLFLERGAQALDPKGARRGGLAVPLAPPALQLATQHHLHRLGYVIDFLDPRFNEYLGATMQGGVSGLYGLTLVGGQDLEGLGNEDVPKAVYTRDWKAVREQQRSHRKG